ncbi:MAG: 4Fe-4S double cluster binding domain-containing protein [Candidatus Thorarchaeota archaeon]
MTKNEKIIKKFYKTLEEKGYKGKIVNANRISDLRKDIQNLHNQNQINSEFYEEYKHYLEFEVKADLPIINSLFIISKPQPQFEAIFHWNNKRISLIIPPTYIHGLRVTNEMVELVNNILKDSGFKAVYAMLPQKTLATHCGLAEYGRNNITYVPGMGSFHRLTTLYSDFPFEEDYWQERRMMDICKECSACLNKCPTGAIPKDRFLLRVEKCLTYHNEHPADVPFPDWIDPKWHNCLIGCLHCQKVCPANKKTIKWIEPGPEFNEEETNMILKQISLDQLPDNTKNKLEEHDLIDIYDIIPRNLSVILKES